MRRFFEIIGVWGAIVLAACIPGTCEWLWKKVSPGWRFEEIL